MMYITQQKEGKVCVVTRDFKFPFWIPESDMRLLKLYSPRQFIITTSQIPQPSTSQVNTSVIQAQSSAEPVVAQSDTDRQGTFASLSGVKTSETATSDNVLASISQEPVKSEPVVSSTETEEVAQSDSEPVENALSFDTLPEEQKKVYQGMAMTLLKNLKPEEIWEHTEKLKAEGLDYDSVIAKLRELNGQSEADDDDDWSDSDDDEWEETEDVTSVLEAEEEEGSENDVIDWESDDDEDDDGVVDYSDDVTGSTDATTDEYDDDGDYYDDDELFPDNLEDSEDWSQDDDDDDEESLSPFYWDWGATVDAINSHDDEALYNGYIPHKIADYPDRTPVNWDSDFAMFQNGATAIDDDEECESIYDYLTPDEVSLFQKYTMYLADRALSFDKGTINIDSLMHKKIESYKATKGSDTEWRYAGFVDMGYKGASRCQFCNSKLNYTAVSSCCGAPITRMGLFTYDHDEEGKPLKQKREVKSYYGKCDVCGAPVSVLMNRQGFDSKSKLRKTTNPSWCAAKVGEDQICGTVVEQNTHYDLLNNAVRFCHLMVNVKKQTMSQFYCDTLLNADISKFIESDDVVKLGIGKAADFLGVAKDSPAFEIFHEVEKTLVNDTISLLNVYKAKKAGKEFDFSFMHSMIDAYLANFDMADFMGTESTETHVIDICILNMAKQMLDSGMVPPISLVRFVRDYFLCWDARQFTISSARYGTPTIANWHLCGGIKGWWKSWQYDDFRKDWKYNNNPEVNADYANAISRSIGTVIDSSGFYTTELYEYLCNVIPQVGVSGLNIYDRIVTYVLRDGILGNYAYLFGSISEGGKSESAITTYKNVYEPANKFVAQLTGTSETSPDSQYRMAVMPKDSEEAKKIKGSKLGASDFADYNALRNISLENFIVILKTAVILRKISSKGYFNLIWTSSNYRSYPFKWTDRNSMGFKNAFYNEILSTQTRYLKGLSGTVNPVLVALGFHEDLLYRAGYADNLNSSIEDLKAFINTWESLTTKELGIFTGEIQFTEQIFSELGGKDWRFVPAIKDTLTAVAKKCLDSQVEYRHWDDITKPESVSLSVWSMLMLLMYSRRQLLSWCEKTPSLRSTLDSYDEEYISLRGVPGSWRAVNPLTVENAKKVMKEDASDYSDLWYLIVAGIKRGVTDTDDDVKNRPHLLYRSLEAAQKDLSANDGWVSWCRSIANSTLAKAIAEAKNK